MKREYWHFDSEAKERSGKEDQRHMIWREPVPGQFIDHGRHKLSILRQRREVDEVEFPSSKKNGYKCQQQRNAADHCVDQKLRSRAGAPRAAPQSDKEESRNQTQFPKEKPVKEA